MPDISVNTMVIAIQAVSQQLRGLRAEAQEQDAPPELDQLVEEWEAAADDLEKAYNTASRAILNLPPYDELMA